MRCRLTLCLLWCAAQPVLAAPNDPFAASSGSWGQAFADQWGLAALRVYADVAPAQSEPSVPVIVAVIDTGLDYLHEDFAAERLWHNPAETANRRDDDGNGYVDDLIGWDFVEDTNNPWDQSGHGTRIAGVIGACTGNGVGIAAVARYVQIMPLKVANFTGQARSGAVAAAIDYAVQHGARIVNLSLGGELVTDLERRAAARAAEHGVLIVVAAGNRGLDAGRFGYPSLPDVLVVGASDPNDARAGFSNFGSHVDVIAPGVDVLSLRARDTDFIALTDPLDYAGGAAFVGADDGYYRASGTSFAAATVSGMAAALLTVRPTLDRAELVHLIEATAVDVEAPGTDQRSGHGRVDFVNAAAGDPNNYKEARLAGAELELDGETLHIRLIGSADAPRFARAILAVRAHASTWATAEPPSKTEKRRSRKKRDNDHQPSTPSQEWQQLIPPLTTPVVNDAIGTTTLANLKALTGTSAAWELRLTVTSTDGSEQQAFMSLALPAPKAATEEAAGE